MKFSFKQFAIYQDQTAMKVGTDGVLLGAWASLHHQPQSILDIGAGTGVIALMLAQRSDALAIDAVEIEENAYLQCVDNFENSPWSDRLFCYHASLQELAQDPDRDHYDLIVCNPPFFPPSASEMIDKSRNIARHYNQLPFEELLYSVSQLLTKNGHFAFIIPFSEEQRVCQLAEQVGLFPWKITRVQGTPDSSIKRSLIQCSTQPQGVNIDALVIEVSRHQYTAEYIQLVQDFYLHL